jgi:hypothetical protein
VRIAAFQFKRTDANLNEWVELVVERGTTDISRVTLSDLDGVDCQLSDKAVTLRQGEHARVYWGKGVSESDEIGDANNNGIREIYITDEHPTRSSDQIVLYHNGRMMDAVVYATSATAQLTYEEAEDVQRIISAGLWPQGLSGRQISNAIPSSGNSVHRDGRGKWLEI